MLRAIVLFLLCSAAVPAAAQSAACAPPCRDVVLVCRVLGCAELRPLSPAWMSGRMEGPEHGGFAAVGSASGAEQLVLTCESRGPMSLVLMSGRVDRGEVELRVDGAGIEWLELAQREGVLVGEIPRGSRLVHALQDGEVVDIVSADGRAIRFGLRGSARAIDQAMAYCAER